MHRRRTVSQSIFNFILFFILISTVTCGKNEIVHNCLYTCDNTCDNPKRICPPLCILGKSCSCAAGFVRNDNNECVTLDKCECPLNEHRQPCANVCEPSCGNLKPVCTEQCDVGSACVCNKGFVRNNGFCTLAKDCKTCGPNEQFQLCSNTCDATCENLNPICTMECREGTACACQFGFVRGKDGKCSPASECSKNSKQFLFNYRHNILRKIFTATCSKNERESPCANPCEPTCDSQNPICNKLCMIGKACTCKEGFVRDKGVCILKANCPIKCKENETFNSCGSSCTGTCRNPNLVGIGCNKMCAEGCFCNKGFTRNKAGRCVKIEKCTNCKHHERTNGSSLLNLYFAF